MTGGREGGGWVVLRSGNWGWECVDPEWEGRMVNKFLLCSWLTVDVQLARKTLNLEAWVQVPAGTDTYYSIYVLFHQPDPELG